MDTCRALLSDEIVRTNIGSTKFSGIFNTTHPSNPVARWNHVYIPYCTGDLHGGVREEQMCVASAVSSSLWATESAERPEAPRAVFSAG